MSGLFGKPSNALQQEVYAGIQVSTSQYGQPIPYVAGRQRIPMTLMWYGNFQSHAQSSGGGKGGGSGTSTYSYSAAWIAALSLGPIVNVFTVWKDKALTTISGEGLFLSLGGSAPPIWGGYPSGTPAAQEIPYNRIAYVAASNFNLGNSASMPNLTFETEGVVPGFSDAHSMFDADPSAVIPHYLTDAVVGAGFQGAIQTLTGATNSYQAYCMSLGLLVSPYEDTQRAATDFVKELLQITNSDCFLSVGTLKILPLADQAVSGTTPDGSVWSYTPNLTPVFAFTDDHFVPHPGEAPVKLMRKPLNQTHNMVNLEYKERSDYYNVASVNASILADIALYGPRLMSALTFHQITNSQTALMAAQLILQADLYERNTYEFRVRQDFCQIEPLDYISITDSGLGLAGKTCRVLEVQDDAEDVLTIKAIEIPGAARTSPQYNWGAAAGFAANYATAPGSVVAPIIFQMPPVPASLSEGITIGIAVCGATASTNWKGCDVYCSADGGNTYEWVGQVGPTGPARYGTLTANLPAVADPDTTSTLSVALANTTLQLGTSVTHAQADAAQTLLLVGSGANAEVMAYGAGTLVSAGNYNLSYLRRNLYGSVNQLHSSGAPFVRLDGAIFQLAVDPGMAGQVLNFKFTSFNTWGRAEESLASVTAYPYTVPLANPIGGAVQLIPRGSCAFDGERVYKATTGANGWDSDCVSANAYSAVSVSAQYSAGGALSIGLATSTGSTLVPASTSGYYGIFAHKDLSNVVVFEGGNIVFTGAAPVVGDLYLITYNGFQIRYFINGTLVRTTMLAGANLFIGFAQWTPGAVFSSVQPTANTGATPTQWAATANCVVNDTNAMKQGGSAAFDSAVYSITGYATCHVTAKANATASNNVLIGVSTTPTAGNTNSNANYAWSLNSSTGKWDIEEAGVVVVTGVATASTSDVVAITYDGATVTYYLKGVSQRTVSIASLTLYGFCSFKDPGAGINSLRFGPTTNLAVAATSQIDLNAATVTVINQTGSSGTGITGVTGLINIGFVVNPAGPGYDCTAIVTATIQARQTVGTLGQVKALARFADDGSTYVSASHEEPVVSSSFQTYTLQWQFSHTAANAGVGQAGIWFDNTGPSTNSFDWQSATIQVEYVIR